MKIPLASQLHCIECEIAERRRSNQLKVARGEMRAAVADLAMMHIAAVAETLRLLARHEQTVRDAVRAAPAAGIPLKQPLSSLSLTSQIACIQAELAQRRRTYAGLVRMRRMPQRKADEGIANISAVLATLEWLQRHEQTVHDAIAAAAASAARKDVA